MEKISVLLLCRHNSGRSQIAEAFFNEFAGYKIHAESAGLEPRELNPLVIEVMQEAGYDISEKQANHVFTYFKEGRPAAGLVCEHFESHRNKAIGHEMTL